MTIRVERTKGQAGRLGGGQHVERHRKVICKRLDWVKEQRRVWKGGGSIEVGEDGLVIIVLPSIDAQQPTISWSLLSHW